MIFVAILVGVLALICAVVYAAFLLAYWLVIITFFALAIIIGLIVGDPALGFFAAIPATALVFWAFGRGSEPVSKE